MSSRYRNLLHVLFRFKQNCKSIPVNYVRTIPGCNATVPATLGFSLFTWLGFQKKLSVEDELILTIKHCVLFIERNEYDKAEQLLHVALRQAQQVRNQLGITYIYDVMANLALEREQLNKAKELFVAVAQRIMADGATEDDARVVHLSVKLARISHLQKEYSTAQLGYEWCIEKLKNALLNVPDEDTSKLLALAEDWYGRLLLDCNKYEQGLKFMLSALDRMKTLPTLEKEHVVVQLNDIGTVCDQLNKTEEGIEYFKEAIDIGKKLDNTYDLGITYVNLGRAYLKKNLIEEARKHCGYAWRLGVINKNKDVKNEAESCITQIKHMT